MGRADGRARKSMGLLRSLFAHWIHHDAFRNSAALAFYTLVTLAPVLVVVIGLAGIVFEESQAATRIAEQFETLLGPQAAEVVEGVLESIAEGERNLLQGIVGVTVFVVGTTAAFSQLQDALNTVFGVPRRRRMLPSLLRKRLLSFAMVLGIGVLLLAVLAVGAVVSFLQNRLQALGSVPIDLIVAANVSLSLLLVGLLFALVYWVLPDADLDFRDAAVGALATTVLFAVGRLLIGLYMGHTENASPFGAAGSVVVFLLWIYYSSLIFLLGAELTREYALRRRRGHVEPTEPIEDSS